MHDALRIIDANFNRSREALRVMEEYARFCLGDSMLTERCKMLRHELSNIICALELRLEAGGTVLGGPAWGQGLPLGWVGTPDSLITARDTSGDVGTTIENETEYGRRDTLHVAMAATKRLTEALRAIEEYSKLVDVAASKRVEQVRYRAYEVERSLTLTASAQKRFLGVRLYVLITEALCEGDWFDTGRAVLENGADCVQLREKDLGDAELVERAMRLAEFCRETEKLLIINDRADIAAASGAHGVHLGQDDMGIRAARRILPSGAIVGVSTHTVAQVEAVVGDTPDYVAVGPMFATGTKPQEHIAGVETLVLASEKTALPLVAIGGLDAARSGEILNRAKCCVCVCSSLISQRNVVDATRSIRTAIDKCWELRQDG